MLALELRRLKGGDLTALVPMVFGQTERAGQEKSPSASKSGKTIAEIISHLEEASPPAFIDALKEFIDWSQTNGYSVRSGQGIIYFGHGNKQGQPVEPFSITAKGRFTGQFVKEFMSAPFDAVELQRELRARLEAIEGVHFSINASQYPSCSVSQLTPASFLKFRNLLEWVKAQTEQAV
jgi:hypothetical protein